MSILHTLPAIKSKSKKRVGRGNGSGKGNHTVGKGSKGQKSRGSGKVAAWFEGGQLPLIKRLPMWRGKGRLKSIRKIEEISLDVLDNVKSEIVTVESLREERIIAPKIREVKVIATGKLNRKLTLQGIKATKSAKEAIEKAGGSIN